MEGEAEEGGKNLKIPFPKWDLYHLALYDPFLRKPHSISDNVTTSGTVENKALAFSCLVFIFLELASETLVFCAALLKTVHFKDIADLTFTKEEAKRCMLEGQ